ncbi:MAG: inorganic pyrophosphatase [Gemmatimonadetes bacterium]|nr:inorganic pyrophosphatase [Gemmatimonadota bacterium]
MPTPRRRRRTRKADEPATPPVSRFRPHPWHGLDTGPAPPEVLNVFVEITPFDLMKYEVDKASGYLRIDRPQRSSSQPPSLYGFVPRTFCDERVRKLAPEAKRGDGDPLDICVLSERAIARNEIIVRARVIGGLQMIDGGEADDKIIGVLENDYMWGAARDVDDVPPVLIERLQHYFLTYKLVPGEPARAHIARVYGRAHALRVIRAAMADYDARFTR